MAFCSKCGAQMNAGVAFCASCGAPAGANVSPTGLPVGPAMAPNVSALLTYIPFVGWIIALVFLALEPYKNDRFVRFHAFQSIFFAIVCAVFYWVLDIFVFSAGWGFGFSMFWPLWGIIRLAIFLCWLFLMYKAYNNERFMLPVIGEIAAKQAT